MRHPAAISPVMVFLLVLAVVFAVESAIMLVLPIIASSPRGGLTLSLVDSAVLVGVLSPALWLLVVRPLRSLVAERGALLARTLNVQEEERAKLARDLHDDLGQAQTAILLGLHAVSNAPTLDQARERAQGVHQMAVAAVDATRRMARGLSPGVLTDLGLGPAVDRVCEDVAAASGLDIVRDVPTGGTRLDPTVEIAAYRVLQEAITNAAKHSGATTVRVRLHIDGERLCLSVHDNGRGIPPQSARQRPVGNGLGITGMRERVVLLNGDFAISSDPSGGTTLNASIPIHQHPS